MNKFKKVIELHELFISTTYNKLGDKPGVSLIFSRDVIRVPARRRGTFLKASMYSS